MNSAYEYNFLPIEDAIKILLESVKIRKGGFKTHINESIGMILNESIVSPVDVPEVNRSAVDGFAVCSDEVSLASFNNPVILALKKNGEGFDCSSTVQVNTGMPIPSPYDSVVMKEDARIYEHSVHILKSVPKYGNVSKKGEDLKKGDIIAEKGQILKPWHISLFASVGIKEVEVLEKIKIGIIATGSEVVDINNTHKKGEFYVFDSTSRLIYASLIEHNFLQLTHYGVVEDEKEKIVEVLKKALEENDIVITTGGTGPGERDLTFDAILNLNGQILSRGIAMRPGRPTTIALIEGKPIFLFSGYPVASFVALRFIFLPFLSKYFGTKGLENIEIPAKLTKRVTGGIGYDTFIRVNVFRCGDELCAEPVMLRGSGILSSLLKTNAFMIIPRNVEGFEEGETVWVHLI
ncbi:molybdopterin molybdotransferase MoeA [Fervidicoccus sp.]|uniref:molybdopterin molybdotransferase MoeA n=1 Tax=Fervidicoccus sp. TaxID=2060324 RepID=UPI003D0EE02F